MTSTNPEKQDPGVPQSIPSMDEADEVTLGKMPSRMDTKKYMEGSDADQLEDPIIQLSQSWREDSRHREDELKHKVQALEAEKVVLEKSATKLTERSNLRGEQVRQLQEELELVRSELKTVREERDRFQRYERDCTLLGQRWSEMNAHLQHLLKERDQVDTEVKRLLEIEICHQILKGRLGEYTGYWIIASVAMGVGCSVIGSAVLTDVAGLFSRTALAGLIPIIIGVALYSWISLKRPK